MCHNLIKCVLRCFASCFVIINRDPLLAHIRVSTKYTELSISSSTIKTTNVSSQRKIVHLML